MWQEKLWEQCCCHVLQPGPCCGSPLQLLAQPVGDKSHGLASRRIEMKVKTTIFFPINS